jgi:hypothetical protein
LGERKIRDKKGRKHRRGRKRRDLIKENWEGAQERKDQEDGE